MVKNVLSLPDEVELTESFLNETCLQNPYVVYIQELLTEFWSHQLELVEFVLYLFGSSE